MTNDVEQRKALYASVWRWHFYAGLYVAPFLVILAFTGLVMLARDPIDRWQLGELLTTRPAGVLSRIKRGSTRLERARAVSARPRRQ